ncbi:hypothetical protein CCMSSC00406_0006654 [Pleurotus cornucopiae]|uniref:Uncharacterized protein n=1 Tax=Pleurotus cornucopiae TaxID=5321 RepID=A0ACB7IS76_PLECO|nr:hypothetical protein CCMSSC00406_0006654 [Pleurotus cornucopiae]
MADDVPPGRSVDIELGGQEVITIDLDNLDPNPEDVLELLKEGLGKIWVWSKLAAEYWRRGYLDAAERIAHAVVDKFQSSGTTSSLPPIYMLLANIQIARARDAPKVLLPDARQDVLTNEKTKEAYHKEAALFINTAERYRSENQDEAEATNTLSFLTRGVQQLATRSIDDALRSFESVLTQQPNNLVALLGKARILYARRQYPASLKIFQNVLQLNPNCKPDPRIGIGLCLWAMDYKSKARAAWHRSLELHDQQVAELGEDDGEGWPAQLLLGLDGINSSKNEQQPEQERKRLFVTGTKLVETAFRTNRKSAAAANALCEIVLQKGNHKQALKLAERTVQFADTLTVLTDGYLRAARVSHAQGSLPLALKYYKSALDGQPKNIVGSVGQAQLQLKNDNTAAAIHTLNTLLQAPNPQKSAEATIMLASLLAHPRPGVSKDEAANDQIRARDLFDSAMKGFELEASRNGTMTRSHRSLVDDTHVHVEVARLWRKDNLDRVSKALHEALRTSEHLAKGTGGAVDPRLLNNIGALMHISGDYSGARSMYERALTASATSSEVGEGASTSILYNLARVYEDQGAEDMARDAYDKLLARHPEYVDAKIRQAYMLTNLNRNNEALDLIKQALSSQSANLELRAFYTYFLIQTNLPKVARDFVYATLKDHDRHDVYSLCASGWIIYNQARESRDTSHQGAEDRRKNYLRSAEFYEKALQMDPMCAFAAQGLAIVTAEDALGPPTQMSGAEGVMYRMRNAREALDIFAKVRESINDGSVYQNMGHCYYARDEFDRAIESYETASGRFYKGQNISVLLCLCRSWYAKATKDQSFPAMSTALRYAQQALHLQPSDKVILYNIAMIQQKTAELLFTIPPAKRTLKDLKWAIDQAGHAQKLFASLYADPAPVVPYNRDIADQRRKYGESLLRKGGDQLAAQTDHESETQAKLDAARTKRQEEKERQEAIERVRLEEIRREAEKLAEERRIARETAQEWTREVRMESDEERERKAKKPRRAKAEAGAGGSGDEAGEPKKKRRGKLKKAAEGEEEQAVFSDEDENTDRPLKKRGSKKRVVRDDEDEAANPRKKQFKSKEVLSDTDEEMA